MNWQRSRGIWKKIEYEVWPEYCNFCERIGHLEKSCFKKNPSLRPAKVTHNQPKQDFVPLKQGAAGDSAGLVNGDKLVENQRLGSKVQVEKEAEQRHQEKGRVLLRKLILNMKMS